MRGAVRAHRQLAARLRYRCQGQGQRGGRSHWRNCGCRRVSQGKPGAGPVSQARPRCTSIVGRRRPGAEAVRVNARAGAKAAAAAGSWVCSWAWTEGGGNSDLELILLMAPLRSSGPNPHPNLRSIICKTGGLRAWLWAAAPVSATGGFLCKTGVPVCMCVCACACTCLAYTYEDQLGCR